MKRYMTRLLLPLLLLSGLGAVAQSYQVNLAPLDGIELKPDNIFNYQVVNNAGKAERVKLTGTVVFRQQNIQFSYQTTLTVQPGMNILGQLNPHATWNFSSNGLKELFQQYSKLPQGTYEYCVSLQPIIQGGEQPEGPSIDECLYQTVNDIFLISLAEPEDDAKLLETHPNFNWTVNYPFAGQLTYRLRVAPMQKGQNKANAIMRNPAIYTEKNISGMAKMYPATARELEKFKPYAWTVDAYYKDVLLGGAEPWMFTIIEDTFKIAISPDQPYYDVVNSKNAAKLYAVGGLKLKYILNDANADVLSYAIFDEKGKQVSIDIPKTNVVIGDNYFKIDFAVTERLRHMKTYRIEITSERGRKYNLNFIYINQDLIKG